MITSFTAAWNTSTFGVDIAFSFASAPVQEAFMGLTRTDRNGTRPVRLDAGLTPAPGVITTLTDTEASLVGEVRYTLKTRIGSSLSDFGTASVTDSGITTPIIHAVTDPARRYQALTIPDLSAGWEWGNIVTPIIGSEFPRVTPGVQLARTPSLTVICESLADAHALRAALAYGNTYMLRLPEHSADMYFVPLTAALSPAAANGAATVWKVQLDAQEVAWPAGPIQSAVGRSYGDDLAAHPTYDASLSAFPTYSDRLAMKASAS